MAAADSTPSFSFLPLGAIIQEFRVSGHNIVQSFPTAELYRQHNTPYFGETIGRVANRVGDAQLRDLNDGRTYQLIANEGSHSLHGGRQGWGKREFEGPEPVNRDGREAVLFRYVSKNGEEGYPGTVECRVWYKAWTEEEHGSEEMKKTVLEIEYEVEMVGAEEDEEGVEETVVNVANHSYFNLSGDPTTIAGTTATLSTNLHQAVDATSIPTGSLVPHPAVPAGQPFTLGAQEPNVDHCFIVDADPSHIPLDTRTRTPRLLAAFAHPDTGLHLEVLSTEPAFQFYTGQSIAVPAVGGLPARGPRSGFCVEPGRYVNAVNVPEWRGMVMLRRGQRWGSRSLFRAWRVTG